MMDWNRLGLIVAQVVVVVVLGILVAVGRDSAITDGLMVVSGALAGTGIYSAIKKQP
jgi:hypothetical protein